jgi:hypothetical protein
MYIKSNSSIVKESGKDRMNDSFCHFCRQSKGSGVLKAEILPPVSRALHPG